MEDSLVKILTPKRRVDILRDVMQAKEEQRPYVITFCGVNGVGKSTNLAKVTIAATPTPTHTHTHTHTHTQSMCLHVHLLPHTVSYVYECGWVSGWVCAQYSLPCSLCSSLLSDLFLVAGERVPCDDCCL